MKKVRYSIILFIYLYSCSFLDYISIIAIPLWVVLTSLLLINILAKRGVAKLLNEYKEPKIILAWGAVFFMLSIIPSLLFNYPDNIIKQNIYSFINIIILLLAFNVSRKTKESNFFNGLVLVGFIEGAVCLAQLAGNSNAWLLPENIFSIFSTEHLEYSSIDFSMIRRVRGTQLFVHKFSVYITSITVIFYCYIFLAKINLKNKFYLVSIILVSVMLLVATLFTLTRASIFAFLIVLIILIYKSKRKRLMLWSYTLIISLFFFMLFQETLVNVSFDRIYNTSYTHNSDQYRFASYDQALNNFLEAPFWGTGLIIEKSYTNLAIHAVPLNILSSFGLFGFIVYCIIWVYTIKFAFAIIRKSSNPLKNKNIFISLLLVLILDNITHTSGYLYHDAFQAFIIGATIGQFTNKVECKLKNDHYIDHRSPVQR